MSAFMRHLLRRRQQTRSYLVRGAGAEGACVIPLLRCPWLIQPCLLVVSSSQGGRSRGGMRCSWSSARRQAAVSSGASVASGEAQTMEEVWEEYFAHPSQWWDNRDCKASPESADFEHKVGKKALWVDGWSTPAWVKAMLKLMARNNLASQVGYHTSVPEKMVQANRLAKGNFGRTSTLPSSAREAEQTVDVGGGRMHIRSARSTSEALDVLKNRLQEGISINSYMFVEVLKRCLEQADLAVVRQVHECVVKSGIQESIYLANNVLSAYIRCGALEDAWRVFEELVKKDVISWNVMIGGYTQQNRGEEAMEVFNRMRQEGVLPDAVTYLCILKACVSLSALILGKEIHGYIRDGGFDSDVRVGTALLKMYAKCGSMKEARMVFDKLRSRNIISWNVMIGAYAESGCGEEAYRLLLQMKREGFEPDAITYVTILNACASAGALEWVKEVHGHVREAGLELNVRVASALINMYAKCGSVNDAREVFERMKERDVVTWTVMIGGLAQHGCGLEAFELILRMKRTGFQPDAFTYASVLNGCASAGSLERVKEVHGHAREAGFDSDARVGNALIHMYAKCGSIDDARLCFDKMKERDLFTWTVMIGGLAQHGCGSEALEVFRVMIAAGVKPDGLSFVAVLSACSHAGLVDEGRRLFLAMSQDYGIVPSLLHWNCLVDILGRAGHLEEAKLLMDNMPVEPDGATWGALLGACRSYGNVELGELAAKERLKLEPNNASTYVLLSNIYAGAEKWEKVSWVRTMMRERGIRKEPGRSWIEVDNETHSFVVGDTSHPETKEIYAELSRLTEKIKGEGYLPDTRLVLHDVGEEDKELSLCSHSEKLAIAYGLIHSQDSKPVRVFKNLRVCSDCHTATKLMSKVTGKEIVVRDGNRFHHFKDGLCTCNDYW